MKITYLGHASFLVDSDKGSLVFDPFLSAGPFKDSDIKADYLLISHRHNDHDADAAALARAGATIITTFEVANYYIDQGLKAETMHIGGQREFPFGRVRVTPAFHGSGVSGGHACGFIVEVEDKRLYHAGDTGLFGDMKLLGEIESIDLAFLPIGSNFTMDAADALLAVKMLQPRKVIPMHYNTFPVIQADPVKFKEDVEKSTSAWVDVLSPGESLTF